MRILNDESDKKLDAVSVFLTKQEVKQLIGYLTQLIENPKLQHMHLSSEDYQKEITICMYDGEDLSGFSQRAKKLISADE